MRIKATLCGVSIRVEGGETLVKELVLALQDGQELRVPANDKRTPDTLLKKLPKRWTVTVEEAGE